MSLYRCLSIKSRPADLTQTGRKTLSQRLNTSIALTPNIATIYKKREVAYRSRWVRKLFPGRKTYDTHQLFPLLLRRLPVGQTRQTSEARAAPRPKGLEQPPAANLILVRGRYADGGKNEGNPGPLSVCVPLLAMCGTEARQHEYRHPLLRSLAYTIAELPAHPVGGMADHRDISRNILSQLRWSRQLDSRRKDQEYAVDIHLLSRARLGIEQ
jgi:hypothetical protein